MREYMKWICILCFPGGFYTFVSRNPHHNSMSFCSPIWTLLGFVSNPCEYQFKCGQSSKTTFARSEESHKTRQFIADQNETKRKVIEVGTLITKFNLSMLLASCVTIYTIAIELFHFQQKQIIKNLFVSKAKLVVKENAKQNWLDHILRTSLRANVINHQQGGSFHVCQSISETWQRAFDNVRKEKIA